MRDVHRHDPRAGQLLDTRERECLLCVSLPYRSIYLGVRRGPFELTAEFQVNLAIIFISIGFAANSLPNYAAAFASSGLMPGPVQVQTTIPGQPLFVQINGVFNMVFAYGGVSISNDVLLSGGTTDFFFYRR